MSSKPNIIVIIPARGGSKRLPNKHTLLIANRPVIAYSIISAMESKYIDSVIVNTDSSEITTVIKGWGARVHKRPKELATDTARLVDVLRYSVFKYEEQQRKEVDIVMFMQADCPVRKFGVVDEAIEVLLENPRVDSAVTVRKVRERPEWMKYKDNEGFLKPYMDNKNIDRKQDLPVLYNTDGYAHAIRRKALMTRKPNGDVHYYFGNNVVAIEQSPLYSIDIDTEEDYRLAKALIENEVVDVL